MRRGAAPNSSFSSKSEKVSSAKRVQQNRLAQSLLWVATVRVVLVTSALVLAFWQIQEMNYERSEDIPSWQYLVIGVAYGLGLLGILALRTGKYLKILAYAQVVADSAVVTAVVVMTGGVDSVFAFTYVFVVLEGSMVLLGPGAAVATSISTILFGAVTLLQLSRGLPGVLPPIVGNQALFSFFVQTTGVGMVGFLASRLSTKLQIAGRRLAEQAKDLKRLGEFQSAILRALPAGLVTVGPDEVVQFGNDSAHSILHLSDGQLVGRSLSVLLPEVSVILRRLGGVSRESTARTRHEASVILLDSTPIRLGFSLAPLPMSEGPSTIVVFQDVTEVVRLEEAVARAERLALVGRFAAGLAHEVRNPLASMCASIDALDQSLQPPPHMQRLMQNIVREASRLDHLIRDFLTLARPHKLTFEVVDLGNLVHGVLELFKNDQTLMAQVEVEFEADDSIQAVVDQNLVRQVLWNLMRNAAQAMEAKGGTLRVDVRQGEEGPEVAVSDTGSGMTDEQRRQAFDPFYTTKKGGSGLGLAISQSIVQAHGGELELHSQPSVGTIVFVRFRDGTPAFQVPLGESIRSSQESEVS